MKLIVLAYTSKTYKSEPMYTGCQVVETDRADLTRKLPCMDTWVSRLKDKGYEVIFFDGDNSAVSFDAKNQLLHVTESDVYDYFYLHQQNKPSNMLKKLQGAVRWLLDNRDFDYILRVDDGTYVNSYVIQEYLETIKNNDIVWSGQGGGGGIFFSKSACIELLKINKAYSHLEDICIFSHFSNNPDYKIGSIRAMSSFYNLGEKNLTIHYATGKRMYYTDFIISNYYNNIGTNRRVILNYKWDPNVPLNTNRVGGTPGNTGAWYGLDRDRNNWEYYGNYARSIVNMYPDFTPYGENTMKKLCIFNFNYPDDNEIQTMLLSLYNSISIDGELILLYNTVTPNIDTLIEKKDFDRIIRILDYSKLVYTVENYIKFKEYLFAEYIAKEDIGSIIKIKKI